MRAWLLWLAARIARARGSAGRSADPSAQLLALAAELPNPVAAASTHATLLGSMLGLRAAALFRGFLACASVENPVSATVLLRAQAELAILLTWVAADPQENGDLWFAQSESADLRALAAIERSLGPYRGGTYTSEELTEARTKRKAELDEFTAEAKARGRHYGRRLAPSLEQMAAEASTAFPGQRTRLAQAYDLAFRGFSPWTHSEASSFKYDIDEVGGNVRYLGENGPLDKSALLTVSTSLFAHSLGVAGGLLGLEAVVAEAARISLDVGGPARSGDSAEDPN